MPWAFQIVFVAWSGFAILDSLPWTTVAVWTVCFTISIGQYAMPASDCAMTAVALANEQSV